MDGWREGVREGKGTGRMSSEAEGEPWRAKTSAWGGEREGGATRESQMTSAASNRRCSLFYVSIKTQGPIVVGRGACRPFR